MDEEEEEGKKVVLHVKEAAAKREEGSFQRERSIIIIIANQSFFSSKGIQPGHVSIYYKSGKSTIGRVPADRKSLRDRRLPWRALKD